MPINGVRMISFLLEQVNDYKTPEVCIPLEFCAENVTYAFAPVPYENCYDVVREILVRKLVDALQ